MCLGQSLYQTMQAQSAQLVAHATRGDFLGAFAQQDSELLAQVLVGEPARNEHEHQHRIENRLRVGVAKAQCAGALPLDLERALQVLKGVVAQRAVMADLLNLQQPPVGGKADAP